MHPCEPDACGWLTHGFAPVVTGPPSDQSSCVGGGATFKVRVEGSEPMSYRWYFNGTNLLTAETNAELNLVNLETNQPRWLFIDTNTPFTPAKYFRARLLP